MITHCFENVLFQTITRYLFNNCNILAQIANRNEVWKYNSFPKILSFNFCSILQ